MDIQKINLEQLKEALAFYKGELKLHPMHRIVLKSQPINENGDFRFFDLPLMFVTIRRRQG